MNRKRFQRAVSIPFLVMLIAAALLLWQRQAVTDWLRLRGYDPPASVAALADDSTMTPVARKIFYVNHPELADRSSFNTSCSNRGEQTIVLGCYHSVDRGIYVFHVSDDRLKGVDQVTAAHEMLHAAYDRLSSSEKKRINTLLMDYYQNDLTDERIKTVMDSYKKTEPNDLVNEMHSIFGTEIAVLPAELSRYYERYFTNRDKLVGYASAYQGEFSSRQKAVSDYDSELSGIKQQIDSNTTAISNQEAAIATARQRLDDLRSNGSIEAYNAAVPGYNARIDAYNDLIDTTKALISNYNQTVSKRNQVALQVTDLAHAIDSSFQPIQN